MSNNTKLGTGALQNNSGNNNTGLGAYASYDNTNSINNTAVGSNSSFFNTTGANNTSIGSGSMCNNTTGSLNTAVGSSALEGVVGQSVGNQNTAVGIQALYNNSADQNTAVGSYSMIENTTGEKNVAVGFNSLYSNTTGKENVGIGFNSLFSNSSGENNTAIGFDSLFSNSSGENNTAIGHKSLVSNTTGVSNDAFGFNSLYNNTTGIGNVAFGHNSGYNNVSGQYNTYLGSAADADADNLNYSTAIGHNARVTESNQMMLGGDNGGTFPNVIIPGNAFLSNFEPPTISDNQIVPKSYIDTIGSGLKPTQGCICATTGPITLGASATAPDPLNTDDFDLSLLADGTSVFILVVSQGTGPNTLTDNTENGVYVFQKINSISYDIQRPSTPPMNNSYDAAGAFSFVQNGTNYGKSVLVQINDPAVIGPTDPLQYTQFYQFKYVLGQGLNTSIVPGGDVALNVDSSLNFINFLDSKPGEPNALSTLKIGTLTPNTIIGATGGDPVLFNAGITVTDNASVGGTSTLTGHVGIGGSVSSYYTLDVNGNAYIFGATIVETNFATATSSESFSVKDNSRGVFIIPRSTASFYNPAISTDDILLFGKSSSPDTHTLTLSTYSSTNSAVKISPTSVLIGAGGTTAIATTSILCDGTNITVTNAAGKINLVNSTSGANNLAVGQNSQNSITTGIRNHSFGIETLYSNTTGQNNSAFGFFTLYNNIDGSNNSAFGYEALYTNTTGYENSAFGVNSLLKNVSGHYNCAFGVGSLGKNTSGSNNNSFGRACLNDNTTGGVNNAFGTYALQKNLIGSNNCAFGHASLEFNNATGNSAFGAYSVQNNITGVNNSAFGGGTLAGNTSGSYNTGIGFHAGKDAIDPSYCTFLGALTDFDVSANLYSQSTAVGYGATITGSNQIVLGRVTEKVIVPGYISSGGPYWRSSFDNGSASYITIGASATAQVHPVTTVQPYFSSGITVNTVNGNWLVIPSGAYGIYYVTFQVGPDYSESGIGFPQNNNGSIQIYQNTSGTIGSPSIILQHNFYSTVPTASSGSLSLTVSGLINYNSINGANYLGFGIQNGATTQVVFSWRNFPTVNFICVQKVA